MLSSTMQFFIIASVLGCFVIVQSELTWQRLEVTWGSDLFSPWIFASLPQIENQALDSGFVKLAGECSEGKFLGSRYMKGSDTAAVLIYDENGYIAGIQNGIPKNDVEKVNTTYSFENSSAYQLDKILGEEEVYFLTAYFVDPNIICNGGRTQEQYEEQGVGTGLHLQIGSDPIGSTVEVPLYEKDTEDTHWVKGVCFASIGVHYWYETNGDVECADFFPMGATYNKGQLTGFTFASFGNYEFSERFEHPPAYALSVMFFADPVPKCLYDEYESSGGFSFMHVFLTELLWTC